MLDLISLVEATLVPQNSFLALALSLEFTEEAVLALLIPFIRSVSLILPTSSTTSSGVANVSSEDIARAEIALLSSSTVAILSSSVNAESRAAFNSSVLEGADISPSTEGADSPIRSSAILLTPSLVIS